MSTQNQLALAERFLALFSGLNRAYGIYDLSAPEQKSTGKIVGKAVTKQKPVTAELWISHLDGTQGVGIIPIRDDNTCVFGAIDVDFYQDFNLAQQAKKIAELNLPLLVCRSKSGGAHLYTFSKDPVHAGLMQDRLREMAASLGLPTGTEIFPKQREIQVDRGDVGGWINIPYSNCSNTDRYALSGSGDQLSAEQFLDLAELLKQPRDFFETSIDTNQKPDPFPDGPPCLNTLVKNGVTEGIRNDVLFQIGVMRRLESPQGWKDLVGRDNQNYFDPPLDLSEVQTIVKSDNRKHYRYSCNRAPLKSVCNSTICVYRKFGVGRDGSRGDRESDDLPPAFPIIGQLRKLMTDPPLWFLDVNDKSVELTTEELQSPNLFQKRIMNACTMMPPTPKKPSWEAMVNDLMTRVIYIEAPENVSQHGQFWELVERFCTKSEARDKDEILNGRAWTDEEGFTWFLMSCLEAFLNQVRFKGLIRTQMFSIMRKKGLKDKTIRIRGKAMQAYALPQFTRLEPKEIKDEDGKVF